MPLGTPRNTCSSNNLVLAWSQAWLRDLWHLAFSSPLTPRPIL